MQAELMLDEAQKTREQLSIIMGVPINDRLFTEKYAINTYEDYVCHAAILNDLETHNIVPGRYDWIMWRSMARLYELENCLTGDLIKLK